MRQGFVLLVIVLILVAAGGCEVWKFRECRKVGHGRVYCLLQIGEK